MLTASPQSPPTSGRRAGLRKQGGSPPARPRVLFLGKTYAGWQTRFLNLQRNVGRDERVHAEFRAVTGWRPGGRIERYLPPSVGGRMRSAMEAAPFARIPRPDVTWTSAGEALLPYLWMQWGAWRRPLVLELDWTIEQQEAMAPAYFGREPRRGMPLALARWRQRLLWSRSTAFVAMSKWAADAVVREGIAPDRVHVIHPGVDLDWWRPGRPRDEGPVRLLFVGGDFARKGGPELLRIFASELRETCELDVVTSHPIGSVPGVRVHRLGPNMPELRSLYQDADLFVLPTKADCFGHVAVEAMACGTPVMMTNVGGASDIVVPGETGWLLDDPSHLGAVLRTALSSRRRLREMGEAARLRAEAVFDGPANDRRLVDLLVALADRRLGQPALS